MRRLPARFDVFGSDISLTSVEEVSKWVLDQEHDDGISVVIANVHTVMTGRRDAVLARAVRAAEIVTPDGMPLVWALRIGSVDATRVTGIDLMRRCLDIGRHGATRHFFYGSTPEVLEAMISNLSEAYPGLAVAGSLSPPFRALSDDDLDDHAHVIEDSRADVVWVGLGMPKQELWMQQMRSRIPGKSLIGVGAAFDWLAGTMPIAPDWMRDRGLEWLFRLAHEPRRLWKRYIYNNPAFLVLLAGRWVSARFQDTPSHRKHRN